jgi:hypothetical protein
MSSGSKSVTMRILAPSASCTTGGFRKPVAQATTIEADDPAELADHLTLVLEGLLAASQSLGPAGPAKQARRLAEAILSTAARRWIRAAGPVPAARILRIVESVVRIADQERPGPQSFSGRTTPIPFVFEPGHDESSMWRQIREPRQDRARTKYCSPTIAVCPEEDLSP